MFNPSVLKLITVAPWRYATQPTYAPDGTELTPGVTQTLPGVFVMIDDSLIATLRAKLPAASKTELDGWVYRVTAAQAAEYNVPMWAGDTSAVFIRVPAATWSNPATVPPAKIKLFFSNLWREPA